MSLQGILEAIEAAGTAEVEQIHSETAVHVEEILSDAREAAVQRRAAARAAVLAPLEAERTRRLRQARSQAAQIVTSAREQLLETALTQTQAHLAALRSTPAYTAILRRLTHEAVTTLQGEDGPLALLADKRDEALLNQIVAKLDPPPRMVAFNLHCWGGVVARSVDGRLEADNRLESRYARAEPILRRTLADQFTHE